jgi:hypothetical protein
VIDAGLKIPAGRKGHLHIATVWAFDLLGLTGRRRNEIVLLKWEMVNWQHAFLDLPDTKGGQLKIQVSKHVLGLLKYIHDQTGNPRTGYVLRGPKGTRIKSINRSWENVRAAAGIPDVRLHDLRHSFASDALMCGVPLAVVGAMLGHKHDRTTQRYAHLANDVVRDGLEAATDRIVGATRGSPCSAAAVRAPHRPGVEADRGDRGGDARHLRGHAHGPAAGRGRDPLGPAQRRQVARDAEGPRQRHDVLAVVRALVRQRDVGADHGRPGAAGDRGRPRAAHTCRGGRRAPSRRSTSRRSRSGRPRLRAPPGPPGGAPPVRLTAGILVVLGVLSIRRRFAELRRLGAAEAARVRGELKAEIAQLQNYVRGDPNAASAADHLERTERELDDLFAEIDRRHQVSG